MKTRFLIIFVIGMIGFAAIQYSHASCVAPLLGLPGPCFDSFMAFTDAPLTERSIMENYARNIELNYGDWQMSDRNWDDTNLELQLPAIICTEFVADGMCIYPFGHPVCKLLFGTATINSKIT